MIGLFLVTSIAAGILGDVDLGEGSIAGLINVLAVPLYLRDLVFLGEMGRDSAAARASSTAGCSPSARTSPCC